MLRILAGTLLLIVLICMSGCQKSASSAAAPAPPVAAVSDSALLGAEFELTSFTMNGQARALPATRRPTLAFPEKGRVAGMAGVNRYSGSYRWEQGKLTIDGRLAMTMMAGPPEAMALETDFGKALPQSHTVSLREGVLRLESSAAQLEFRKKP